MSATLPPSSLLASWRPHLFALSHALLSLYPHTLPSLCSLSLSLSLSWSHLLALMSSAACWLPLCPLSSHVPCHMTLWLLSFHIFALISLPSHTVMLILASCPPPPATFLFVLLALECFQPFTLISHSHLSALSLSFSSLSPLSSFWPHVLCWADSLFALFLLFYFVILRPLIFYFWNFCIEDLI